MEVVSETQAVLGEGPVWDDRRQVLWWVDIFGQRLHRFDPQGASTREFLMPQMIGAVVLRDAGGVVVALEEGFALFDPETETLHAIVDPEPDVATNRFNDGKCDARGRFWAGTMSKSEAPGRGTLYSLEPDGEVRRQVGDVSVSNGLAWSSDNETMYFIDSPTLRIDAFDYALDTGALNSRRTVVQVTPGSGFPDGMAIDAEGMLWVGMWNGWQVLRFDPRTGRQIGRLPVPVAQVTSCAFGGSDLQDLYITTARIRQTDEQLREQPDAGKLFRTRVEVPGLPAARFAG